MWLRELIWVHCDARDQCSAQRSSAIQLGIRIHISKVRRMYILIVYIFLMFCLCLYVCIP